MVLGCNSVPKLDIILSPAMIIEYLRLPATFRITSKQCLEMTFTGNPPSLTIPDRFFLFYFWLLFLGKHLKQHEILRP